jgi:hypothetical protein
MPKLFLIVCVFLTANCGSNDPVYDYQNHRFDLQVIEKLPAYDSLSHLLIQNFSSMQQDIKENNYFDYGRAQDTSYLYKKLPRESADKVISYFSQLGENFINGFAVFKDSTIKYYIRDKYLDSFSLTIRERLSYFPNGGTMPQRESPGKDTALNKNWQYWISFDEKDFFD